MRRLRQTSISWVLCLGILIALTPSADAQLSPLANPMVVAHLRALLGGTRNTLPDLNPTTPQEPREEGLLGSNVRLVQRREPSEPKRQPHDPSRLGSRDDPQESPCAKKIREMFPLVVLPISALDLDQTRLDHRESLVVIPLRKPHEEMDAIWFDTASVGEAMEIIRLLRTGKIGAVSVWPLSNRPSVFYMLYGVAEEDRQACRRERVLELLGACKECELLEWRSLQP